MKTLVNHTEDTFRLADDILVNLREPGRMQHHLLHNGRKCRVTAVTVCENGTVKVSLVDPASGRRPYVWVKQGETVEVL